MTAMGHSVANAERSCGCDCGTCTTASRTGTDTVVLSNPHMQASLRTETCRWHSGHCQKRPM
jgi:hypothetical protein